MNIMIVMMNMIVIIIIIRSWFSGALHTATVVITAG